MDVRQQMIDLSPAERRLLRAHAHKLHPVVMIGDKGLTKAVLQAIDASLKSHELIKVKVDSDDRAAREAVLASICAAVDARPVQHIGKVLVLYRENPTIPTPAAVPAPAARARQKRAGARPSTAPGGPKNTPHKPQAQRRRPDRQSRT